MRTVKAYGGYNGGELVVLCDDGTHDICKHKRGTIFMVSSDTYYGVSGFNLTLYRSTKNYIRISKVHSDGSARFRLPYKNEIKETQNRRLHS